LLTRSGDSLSKRECLSPGSRRHSPPFVSPPHTASFFLELPPHRLPSLEGRAAGCSEQPAPFLLSKFPFSHWRIVLKYFSLHFSCFCCISPLMHYSPWASSTETRLLTEFYLHPLVQFFSNALQRTLLSSRKTRPPSLEPFFSLFS